MGRHLYEALHEIKCGRKTYAEGDIAEWEDDVAATMPEALRGPLNVTEEEDDPADSGQPFTEEELREMGINDLRGVARKLEIPASGKKKDLLARILDVLGYTELDGDDGEDEEEPEDGTGEETGDLDDEAEEGNGDDENGDSDDGDGEEE